MFYLYQNIILILVLLSFHLSLLQTKSLIIFSQPTFCYTFLFWKKHPNTRLNIYESSVFLSCPRLYIMALHVTVVSSLLEIFILFNVNFLYSVWIILNSMYLNCYLPWLLSFVGPLKFYASGKYLIYLIQILAMVPGPSLIKDPGRKPALAHWEHVRGIGL